MNKDASWRFEGDIASLRRILAAARPEVRAKVFADQAREYVNWFMSGLMEKATVIDALQAVGEEVGLGVEVIQQALAAAIENPLTIEASGGSASDQRNHHPEEPSKITQRDKLVIVSDRATFWRCLDDVAHATVPVGNRTEHHRVRSAGFRNWLIRKGGAAYPITIAGKERPGTFGRTAIEEALACCEASAAVTGRVYPARIRVAETDDAAYVDLGDPDWRAVEIRNGAWRIVDQTPIPILRTKRTRAVATPSPGGSLGALRQLLPLHGEDEFRLIVLWLLAALRAHGPYPILALSGEAGSGKSFTARLLRELIDPSGDNIMQPPRTDRDLIAAAKGNHVLAFDNLSVMPGDLADSMCRLATGGDIGGRMLYTDADSAAFAAQRPIIINGIPDLVTRGDLASRAIFVRLLPIQRRRTEAEMKKAFAAAAPGLLGALLDTLARALDTLPNISLPEDGMAIRMADFAQLACAAEEPLGWPAGTALDLLHGNSSGATAMVVEADPVATAVRELVERHGAYSGLVSELCAQLTLSADQEIRRSPAWPKGAARFGEQLRRVAPALRAMGIGLEETRTRAGVRVVISRNKA